MKHVSKLAPVILTFILSILGAISVSAQEFDDTGWQLLYQENFDSPFEGTDGETFGDNNWLILQLRNDGVITVENGYAQLNAPDFWNAALIRSTRILPPEYKIRTKIGYINYDLANYEQADFDDPDFNNHFNHPENGMYFLTVTNDTCIGSECAEQWWHFHRKMVIDVDNHVNWSGGGETFHPVYMVYMDPEVGGAGGNLLRTWDGDIWDTSEDNWNVVYTYEYDTWYYAELEKINDSITLRLYDGAKNIIEGTDPVSLDLVFAMDDPTEFLYVGEPHTDDYEGNVRIDEITLLIPDEGYLCGDLNDDGEVNILDIIGLIEYKFKAGPAPDPMESGNVNGDGIINILDIIYLVEFKYKGGPEPSCAPVG